MKMLYKYTMENFTLYNFTHAVTYTIQYNELIYKYSTKLC